MVALPAVRPALAALAALRRGGGQGLPRAHRRRRRADARPRALDRPAPRRTCCYQDEPAAPRRAPTPRSSTGWWTSVGQAHDALDRPVLRHLMLLLDVEHRFAFDYDTYISESFMELRVQPKTTADQTVSSFVLSVGPPTRVHRYLDWNDNVTHHFTITRFHDRIEVASRSLVQHAPGGAADRRRSPTGPAPAICPTRCTTSSPSAGRCRSRRRSAPRTRRAAPPRTRAARRARAGARRATCAEHFEYQQGRDRVRLDDRGLPQDRGRRLPGLRPPDARRCCGCSGIPCRYVSGYLHVERDDARALAEPRLDRVLGAVARAGSRSIPRTTAPSTSATSSSATAATTTTCRPTRASTAASPRRRSRPRSTRRSPRPARCPS